MRKVLNAVLSNFTVQLYAQRSALRNHLWICYWLGVGGTNYLAGDARLKSVESTIHLAFFYDLWLSAVHRTSLWILLASLCNKTRVYVFVCVFNLCFCVHNWKYYQHNCKGIYMHYSNQDLSNLNPQIRYIVLYCIVFLFQFHKIQYMSVKTFGCRTSHVITTILNLYMIKSLFIIEWMR